MYSPYHFDPLATWGWFSNPPEAAWQMNLDGELPAVPPGGEIVDVGAGVGLSMAAAIYVRRPDIHVTSVDAGFEALGDEELDDLKDNLEGTIEHFDEERQEALRASRTWRNTLIGGLAEELPVASGSADAVISYAAVPCYSPDKRAVLAETLRVLKLGGLAIHGPMMEEDFADWDAEIQAAVAAGEVTTYLHRAETIQDAAGIAIEAYFTRIVK